jgi:hypothetical protein
VLVFGAVSFRCNQGFGFGKHRETVISMSALLQPSAARFADLLGCPWTLLWLICFISTKAKETGMENFLESIDNSPLIRIKKYKFNQVEIESVVIKETGFKSDKRDLLPIQARGLFIERNPFKVAIRGYNKFYNGKCEYA